MWLLALEAVVDAPAEILTPWGLLGVVVLLVLTGKLRPDSHFKELREDRDNWRKAAQIVGEAFDKVADDHDVIIDLISSLRDLWQKKQDP